MIITLDIPEAVAQKLGTSPESVAQSVLENAALEGYRSGKLSHFQVRNMMGFESWTETEQFLRSHGVPVLYGHDELDEDLRAIEQVLGRLAKPTTNGHQ